MHSRSILLSVRSSFTFIFGSVWKFGYRFTYRCFFTKILENFFWIIRSIFIYYFSQWTFITIFSYSYILSRIMFFHSSLRQAFGKLYFTSQWNIASIVYLLMIDLDVFRNLAQCDGLCFLVGVNYYNVNIAIWNNSGHGQITTKYTKKPVTL